MTELTAVALVLGVLLTIVTLVGHGIWLLLAKIFGPRSPGNLQTQSPTRYGARGSCPRCFTIIGTHGTQCTVCGWPAEVVNRSNGQAALAAFQAQVEQLARIGLLDETVRNRLAEAILGETQRLQQQQLAEQQALAQSTAAEITLTEPEAPSPTLANPVVPSAEPVATSAGPEARAVAPLHERARQFAASRAAAAAEVKAETAPAPPPKPAVPVSRLLAAFMEEKNIRWGELVGGLLIVGSSIALVISFWSEIAARPLLKFVLFNGVTAALFGIGLYTDRRWKLHTTSHGVLVIATLLLPLNFLAIAAFTQNSPPTDVLALGGEAASLAVFTALVYLAGRVLVHDDAVLLAAGVMIPSLMQLLVRRFAGAVMPQVWLYGLAAVPIANYLATSVAVTGRRLQSQCVGDVVAQRILLFLGLVSAATLLPLALLVYLVPPIEATLHWLSPLVTICGLPSLAIGLLFWRRLAGQGIAALQTAGIGVGVLGALAMIAAVVLAWPEPAMLLPTALATAAAMLVVAFWFEIPAAHMPAGLALAAAWLVGFYLVRGDITWTLADPTAMRDTLISATSGHALVPLAGIFATIAWWFKRRARREDALMVARVAAGAAVVSLALVVWFGFGRVGDPENATWTLAIYSVAALAAGVVLDRGDVASVGSGLLLAALVQAILYRYAERWPLETPLIVTLLLHATCATAGSCGLHWFSAANVNDRRRNALVALLWSGLVTSAAAAVGLAISASTSTAGSLAVNLAWLAVVWYGMAWLVSQQPLAIAAQVATVLAILCSVTAGVEGREWFTSAAHPWLDPWFLELQGIALAAYCLLVGGIRWSGRLPVLPSTAAMPRSLTIDGGLRIGLVVLLALVAVYAVVPGVAQELAPLEAARGSGPAVRLVPPIEQFEIAGIAHGHAADRGAWALLAAVAVMLVAGLWQSSPNWHRTGLLIAAAAVCPLLAAQWEADVAVASALRWLSAGFFLLASVLVWRYGPSRAALSALAERIAAIAAPTSPTQLLTIASPSARNLLVALLALMYAAMGTYVAQAAVMRGGIPTASAWMWPYVLVWAMAGAVVTLLFPRLRESGRKASRDVWAVQFAFALLTFAPLLVLTTFCVARALDQHPVVGPELTSWFRRIDWGASYGVPLAAIAAAFAGHAIRDRSSRFAFAASLLVNAVATIVVLMRLARVDGGALDAAAWITVTQVNAIVSGTVALVWLAAVQLGARSREPGVVAQPLPLLLITQVILAAALCAMFLLPAVVRLFAEPVSFTWATVADGPLGWTAAVLAAVAAVWLNCWRAPLRPGPIGVGMVAAALVSLAALTATHWDIGNWLAYHTLLVGWCAAAWLLPLAVTGGDRLLASGATTRPPLVWSSPPARLFGVLAVVLAVRGYDVGPNVLWWTVGALTAIGIRNLWIAWHELRAGSVWIAAALLLPAASILWIDWGHQYSATSGVGEAAEFLWINVLATAAIAVWSVLVQRRLLAGEPLPLATGGPPVPPEVQAAPAGTMSPLPTAEPAALRWIKARRWNPATARAALRGIAFHRFAAWAIVIVLLATTAAGAFADLMGDSFAVSWPLAWAAWCAAAIAALACWWDPAIRWPIACLYCVGLIAVGIYLDVLDFRTPMFQWAFALALAAYSLVTSSLWSVRDRLAAMAVKWGVPRAATSGQGWLVTANMLLGMAVLALVWWIEVTIPQFDRRMIAAYAVGAHAVALALLACGAVRTALQYTSLAWGTLFAVAFAWAWVRPDLPLPWLHRFVGSIVALVVTVVVYGFGLVKLLRHENEWTRAAARLVPPLAACAVTLLLVVLTVEVLEYTERGAVPLATPALVAVGAALAGLAVAALVAALVPGRDPLGLSERGRTLYVYAFEGLAALLFVHIRVTMPWLFAGWFVQFWPLVMMGIAFVGVGLGEVFQRSRQCVLAEPLHNTGVLLPLLPAIGFWFATSRVHYSLLLLSIGVLYTATSALRRSSLHAVLAAIAANGSLWFWLYSREGLGFFEHPQLWLIPPALAALAAGYINRARLTDQQSAALRYAAATVVYVSSTADVFINGVAEAPWLPAVLAGLSILGVLAGIMIRVRAFLYLGTAFLLVAILTVIWHAAVEQERTYIWWVAGIVTGVLIIALFGLFEKRRDDVLRLVEQLKHWEA